MGRILPVAGSYMCLGPLRTLLHTSGDKGTFTRRHEASIRGTMIMDLCFSRELTVLLLCHAVCFSLYFAEVTGDFSVLDAEKKLRTDEEVQKVAGGV